MFWAHAWKKIWTVTLKTPKMREANITMHKLMYEEQHMHN